MTREADPGGTGPQAKDRRHHREPGEAGKALPRAPGVCATLPHLDLGLKESKSPALTAAPISVICPRDRRKLTHRLLAGMFHWGTWRACDLGWENPVLLCSLTP